MPKQTISNRNSWISDEYDKRKFPKHIANENEETTNWNIESNMADEFKKREKNTGGAM